MWEWDVAADLGLRDTPAHIVLPILVLDELDGLNEHNKQNTRCRARETHKLGCRPSRQRADDTGPPRSAHWA